MAKMKIAPADRPRVKSECLRILATLRLDPARVQIVSGFVDSYLKLSAREMRIFAREVESLPIEEQEAIMPLTISWKEEGRIEGREEGRLLGEREFLIGIGRKRLGDTGADIVAALSSIASSEQFIRLGERILDVESWEELLADA